jgi:hypothetical protein
VGEGALQLLRGECPEKSEDDIRAAVRAAGVNTRGDLFKLGWLPKAREALQYGADSGTT